MSLQIQTFGQMHVRLDGREVQWRARAALDLLLYLLSHPEGCTRRQLLDGLWAADVNPRSNTHFRVTLHRLRATLGGSGSVTERSGRFHLSADLWRASDIYRLYAALESAGPGHDPAAKIAALESAVEVYHGDYLAGYDAEWTEEAREQHRAAYVRAHLELSRLYCAARECGRSVRALSEALRTDPYAGETHHQRLMICLSAVGEASEATDHYRRFVRFLRDELSDEPLPGTQRLARRIHAGEHLCERAGGLRAPLAWPWFSPLVPEGHGPAGLRALLQADASSIQAGPGVQA